MQACQTTYAKKEPTEGVRHVAILIERGGVIRKKKGFDNSVQKKEPSSEREVAEKTMMGLRHVKRKKGRWHSKTSETKRRVDCSS